MAFGIHSNFDSTSARRALRGIALAASCRQAWRLLRGWIARRRSRQTDTLAELDDRLLRDIGVIRERDIGVSCEAAAHEADKLFRGL